MNNRVQNHLRGTLASSVFLVFFLAFSFILIHDASADETACPSKRHTYHMIDENGNESDAIMLDVFQVKDALAGDRKSFPMKMLDEQALIDRPQENLINDYTGKTHNYYLYDQAMLFKFHDKSDNFFYLTAITKYSQKFSDPLAMYFDGAGEHVVPVTIVGVHISNGIAYRESYQGLNPYPKHIQEPAQFILLTNDFRVIGKDYATTKFNPERKHQEQFINLFFSTSGTWKLIGCAE